MSLKRGSKLVLTTHGCLEFGKQSGVRAGKIFDDRFTLVHFVRQYILEDE